MQVQVSANTSFTSSQIAFEATKDMNGWILKCSVQGNYSSNYTSEAAIKLNIKCELMSFQVII